MAKKKVGTYSEMHGSLKTMTEPEIEAALDHEVNRTDGLPRHDMIGRLLGRLNRLRGNRIYADVIALTKQQGRRDVSAVLHRRVTGARPNQG